MTGRSSKTPRDNVAKEVRERIERSGERLWQFEDFRDLPFAAVAQALSRLCRAQLVERLSKGIYFRGRATAFGPSRPNPTAIQKLAGRDRLVLPAGVVAANLLGFTTQIAARRELATSASSLPRKLVGADTVVYTRRPAVWSTLTDTDAALLDFLRRGGRASELSPDGTVRRTLELLAEEGRYRRLASVATTEPPRVVALLGALGQELGAPARILSRLRAAINPLSRFDFGAYSGLPTAKAWQAKR